MKIYNCNKNLFYQMVMILMMNNQQNKMNKLMRNKSMKNRMKLKIKFNQNKIIRIKNQLLKWKNMIKKKFNIKKKNMVMVTDMGMDTDTDTDMDMHITNQKVYCYK